MIKLFKNKLWGKTESPKSQNSQKAETKAQAQAKAQTDKQSTAQPHMSLSIENLPTKQAELLQKLLDYPMELLSQIPPGHLEEYLQKLNLDALPEEVLLNIISKMESAAAPASFDKLYVSKQRFPDLLQDFRSLINEQIARVNKKYNDELTQKDTLAEKYVNKMAAIQVTFLYDEILLKYTGEFTGIPRKHKLNLQRTQLFRDISVICATDKSAQAKDTETQQYLNTFVNAVFCHIQEIVNTTKCALPPASYQSYLKEVQDSVNTFVLQRVQSALDLNDKYVKTSMDASTLHTLLYAIHTTNIEDLSHIWVQPFEGFLSDDIFNSMLRPEDTMLVFPEILQIQLKYSLPEQQYCFDSIFQQACNCFGITPDEFMAQMMKIREKRLKKAHQEQAQRATSAGSAGSTSSAGSSVATNEQDANVSANHPKEAAQAAQTAKNASELHIYEGPSYLSRNERYDFFMALQEAYPNPVELKIRNHFELLCAEVISNHSTLETVNAVTAELFEVAPTPQKMIELGEAGLIPYLMITNLAEAKAKSLIALCQKLLADYPDAIPDNYKELLTLPGIGPKFAKDILRLAFGQAHVFVNSHIERVCERTGLCFAFKDWHLNTRSIEGSLTALVDPDFVQHAHFYLDTLGRNVCIKKNFENNCATCVAAPWCKYHKEHQ